MIDRDRIVNLIQNIPDEDLGQIGELVEATFKKCYPPEKYTNYLSIAGDVIMDIDRILINLETLTKAFDVHIMNDENVSDTVASFLQMIRDQTGSMRQQLDRLVIRV